MSPYLWRNHEFLIYTVNLVNITLVVHSFWPFHLYTNPEYTWMPDGKLFIFLSWWDICKYTYILKSVCGVTAEHKLEMVLYL